MLVEIRRDAAQILLSSRPISWINTAFPFAAAYLLSGGRVDTTFLVGSLFFLVPYNLAMYGVNDVFDYASDVANPRKGGAEGAVLHRRLHRATIVSAIVACVPFVVVLFALSNAAAALTLCVSLFAVAAYSVPGLRFKEVPFLDSVTSSIHFVSPAVFALTLVGEPFTPALVLLLGAFFLWGVASHAFGAVQDVVPDREAGIASISTVMGARWTVRFSIVAWTAAGLCMLSTGWPGSLAAVLAVPYIALAWPYRSVSDEKSPLINGAWKKFIVLNYIVGFLATMIMILFVAERF